MLSTKVLCWPCMKRKPPSMRVDCSLQLPSPSGFLVLFFVVALLRLRFRLIKHDNYAVS